MASLLRLAVIVAIVCGGAVDAMAQKIQVGYTAVADYFPLFVAKEEGYFAKRNLDVEPVLVALNSTIPQALLTNSLQVGGPTPPVLLQANDGGLDLVALAGGTVTDPATFKTFGVVARKGVDVKTPSDFVGKKVGVPGLGAFLHVLFRHWLIEKGVDYRRVTYVEVTFPTMGDVLKGGTVDAVVSADPIMSRIVAAGTGEVASYFIQDLPPGQSTVLFAATRDWAKKNTATARSFREAIDEAGAFARTNDGKTKDYVAKYTRLPPAVVQAIQLGVPRAELTAAQLGWWIDVMRKQDMLQSNIDPSTLIQR